MATNTQTTVQQLYVAYFSRPADVAGLAYWTNILATNPDGYQMISANFASSAEYKAMYAGQDNRAVVSTVYQHLFGRPAETAGVDYWAKALDNKVITIDNVVTQIAAGAQSTDKIAYDGKVAVAAVFTAVGFSFAPFNVATYVVLSGPVLESPQARKPPPAAVRMAALTRRRTRMGIPCSNGRRGGRSDIGRYRKECGAADARTNSLR